MMNEKKYTKQELLLAFDEGRTKHYLDFADFFTNTFPPTNPPFDLELEKHQYMKDQIDKVMAQYNKKPCDEIPVGYTRENFLSTLASTLTAAEINVSVSVAEKIYKLYNLVQIYGGKVTMEQINKVKVEG